MTIIQNLGEYKDNCLWIKREDLIPFSFGGNKARKAILFFEEIDKGDYDCVVTYGSGSSNHCRIIANQCCRRGMECHIISPEEASEPTFNSRMMELFGAKIIVVPVTQVHDTIEQKIASLKSEGKKPYFIEGGGHGNIGTEAFVQCYNEIKEQEIELGTHFDYIFFASGTGTTHAGLVCGQLLAGDCIGDETGPDFRASAGTDTGAERRTIVGISIARKNPRGRNVVLDSVRAYLGERASIGSEASAADNASIFEEAIQKATIFVDDFTSGYGKDDQRVIDTIEMVLKTYGIPLDSTYTGKAFMGMSEYLAGHRITGKNILFIHTGGTPLFFDTLNKNL